MPTETAVPAIYIGETDYVLSVPDEHEHAARYDITASRDGKPVITGYGFAPPASGGNDPRDDPRTLVAVFGSFLGAEVERAAYALAFPQYADADDPPFDSWTIHDADADLGNLADACALHADRDEQ